MLLPSLDPVDYPIGGLTDPNWSSYSPSAPRVWKAFRLTTDQVTKGIFLGVGESILTDDIPFEERLVSIQGGYVYVIEANGQIRTMPCPTLGYEGVQCEPALLVFWSDAELLVIEEDGAVRYHSHAAGDYLEVLGIEGDAIRVQGKTPFDHLETQWTIDRLAVPPWQG